MAAQTETPNLETMSLDELRKLANEEVAQQEQQQTQTTKPRDEQGRFLATQTEQTDEETGDEEEQEEEEPAKKLYRRVISSDDGADPEVFEADSMEALLDKIADSKAHATRKIREQAAELRKAKTAETPKPRQFSEDEEYVFSQELMTKPTQAINKILKEMGLDVTALKTTAEKVNAIEKARQTNDAIATFLTTHPDYEDSQRNTDVMQLAMAGRDVTLENLEKAYQNLKVKGLLTEGKGKQSSTQEEEEQAESAIPAKQVTTTPSLGTKKSSGLKSRGATPVKSNEPSEADLYNMPLDKLRELGNKHLTGR